MIRLVKGLLLSLCVATLLSGCVVVPAGHYHRAYRPVYVEPVAPPPHWHRDR